MKPDKKTELEAANDIIDKRERERELIRAQIENELQLTKLNAVVKATKIGLYDVGITNNDFLHPDNTVTFTNEFRNMLGYTDENDFPDSIGNWEKHLHPDDKEKAIEEVILHVSDPTGEIHYDTEYRLLRKDGEYAYFRACGEAIRDEKGNVIRIAGALMDMTEIRRREQTLLHAYQMSELQLAKINLINKTARIGLWDMEIIRDDAMNIKNEITFSDEFRAILGYTDENDFPNLLSSFYNCLHPDDYQMVSDRINDHISDLTGATIFEPEYKAKKKNGEYTSIRATGDSIRDDSGEALRMLGTIMDISEEKETLANTERLRREAEEANQAKSAFLANMSHEIRTPLNAVIGLSELVLDSDSILNEENRHRLIQINDAGATLLSTVNDILDISKIESGKFDLVPVKYDVPSVINDAVAQSILHGGDKPIEFVMNICEKLPTILYGDDLRIRQILNNFLSNAFKYTMEGTVELTVNCTPITDSKQADAENNRFMHPVWLTFVIRDTGIGIKEENIDTLFNDYVQIDMSTNRSIKGTGLGLPIAKRLVGLMNGQIEAESEYGKGSVFTVRIMQENVSDETVSPEVLESLKKLSYSEQKRRQFGITTKLNMPYAHVLIVDDVVTNLDVAKGLMKPYNMKIDCVTSGLEAIEAMKNENVRYNAIFMDHMMPGMDGIETTQRIREIDNDYARNIPIIALTANAIVGNEEMFLQRGFQAFISKPIEIMHLDTVIREWIRDKEQEKLYNHMDEQLPPEKADSKNWQALQNNIQGLDIDRGLIRFQGDKGAYVDVLRSFAINTCPLLVASQEINYDNLTDYTTIVHGLKGSSSSICADEIACLAGSLEKAALDNDKEFIESHSAILVEKAEKLISDINKLLEEINADNQKPLKDKPDTEILKNLCQACIDYDMDDVDTALDELESYDYESDGELVKWLRENVERMNFDEIVERLQN